MRQQKGGNIRDLSAHIEGRDIPTVKQTGCNHEAGLGLNPEAAATRTLEKCQQAHQLGGSRVAEAGEHALPGCRRRNYFHKREA